LAQLGQAVNFFLVWGVDSNKKIRIMVVMVEVVMTKRVEAPGALAEQRGLEEGRGRLPKG
jgi:hypothetical protein